MSIPVLRVVIPGKPVPKERARVVRTKGGKNISFTPPATKEFEAKIKLYVMQAVAKVRAVWPLEAEYLVALDFYDDHSCALIIPKGPKPIRRPDPDNLAKALLDGLTKGGAWKDDYMVTELVVRTHFGGNTEQSPATAIDDARIASVAHGKAASSP